MRLLLDTSAYSAMRRFHATVTERIRAAEGSAMSAITLGELLAGFAGGTREAENRRLLTEFLQSSGASVLSVTPATAERYAAIYQGLRQKGAPIPLSDIWIAACAMEHGLKILTLDSHFRHVDQILVDYIPPWANRTLT